MASLRASVFSRRTSVFPWFRGPFSWRAHAFVVGLSLLAAAGCAVNPPPPREVMLMARGMTFVLAAEPDTPNPVIPLRAGERVRLILRNEAPGLLHDIAIPEWEVAVDQIRAGESAEVTFTVPNEIGKHEYRCRPHSEMMKGVVDVTP